MFSIRSHQISIIICVVITIHLFWAWMIARNEAALNATAMSVLYRYIHNPKILIFILIFSSVIAGVTFFLRASWAPLLLIPQQMILMASASATIDATWLGQFADGVARPHEFIAADQVWPVIIAVGHTFAIIIYAMQGNQR